MRLAAELWQLRVLVAQSDDRRGEHAKITWRHSA